MLGQAIDVCAEYDQRVLALSSLKLQTSGGEAEGSRLSSDTCAIASIRVVNAEGIPQHGFYQHEACALEVSLEVRESLRNPAVWVRFMRSDGVLVTSWLSHEPEFHDLGLLAPGEHQLRISIDDLLLGDGTFLISVALFPEKRGAEAAFYVDPLCMWDRAVSVAVKRRGRPLSTLFDQPMRVQVERLSTPELNFEGQNR